MKSKGTIACFFMVIVILSLTAQIPTASADPDHWKVMGSGKDVGTVYYDGHELAYDFAVDMRLMAPLTAGREFYTQIAFAVSLGSGWSVWHTFYTPYVGKMWVNIQGTPECYSLFRIDQGAIVSNTGTSGECTGEFEVLLTILDIIMIGLEFLVKEAPPELEWQGGLPHNPHWAKAIARQTSSPYETRRTLETAACDFEGLFVESGPQYLEITAGAEIWLEKAVWQRWGNYITKWKVGEYSASFQVSVPIDITVDLNYDGIVDILDITIAALAFESMPWDNPATPGDENANWNAIADVNDDSVVDIFDIQIIAAHMG